MARLGRIIRRIFRIFASVLVTVLIFWAGWMLAVIMYSSMDQAQPADAIVVLGAAQYDGRPSPVLKARLDHAIGLWNRRIAGVLIVTGGTGSGDTTSEAAVGRTYARKHGVPDSAILLESEGRETRESMLAVSRMMEQRGQKTAILVSDPFHMLRLSVLGRRFGMIPYTSPTRTSPISPNREERWRYMLGESMKVPLTFLFERKM